MFRPKNSLLTYVPHLPVRRRLVDEHLKLIFSQFHGVKTPTEAAEWMVKQYGDRKSGVEFRPLFHNYAYGFHKKRFLASIFSLGHRLGMARFMKAADPEMWERVGSPTEPTIIQINDWTELFLDKTDRVLDYDQANKYNLIGNLIIIVIAGMYIGWKHTLISLLFAILFSEGLGYAAGGAACGSSTLTYAMFGLAFFAKRPYLKLFSAPNLLDALRIYGAYETYLSVSQDPTGQRIAHGAHAFGVLVGFIVNWLV